MAHLSRYGSGLGFRDHFSHDVSGCGAPHLYVSHEDMCVIYIYIYVYLLM